MKYFVYTLRLVSWGFIIWFVLMTFGTLGALIEEFTMIDLPFIEKIAVKNNELYSIGFPITGLNLMFPLIFKVLASIWIMFAFYATYFYFLKKFFSLFLDNSIFEKTGLHVLKVLLLLNTLPIITVFGFFIYRSIQQKYLVNLKEDWAYALLHGFAALFIYFYYEIAKKGNVIKNENDLTI